MVFKTFDIEESHPKASASRWQWTLPLAPYWSRDVHFTAATLRSRLRRAACYPRGAARGPQARRAAPLNPDLCVGAPFMVLAPESGDPPVRAKMVAVILPLD